MRRRAARVVRVLEQVLFASGLLCLAIYVSACAQRAYLQAQERQAFERAVSEAIRLEEHDQSEWSSQRIRRFEASRAHPTRSLGRLDIPAAGISVMVLEGTDDATLDRAVGRIPGTARPGEPGNLGIAGHRDSFFRGLRHLKVGDELTLATLDGVAHYTIEELQVVDPEDVEVLATSERTAITLVTCHPFYYVGAAPRRFIVRAYQVRFDPWTGERLTSYVSAAAGR